jgi:drug/metabolite transporter (DMT)-like permease
VVGRAVHESLPPIGLAFWRWVVALAAMLPFAAGSLWRARKRLREAAPILLALGLLGAATFQTLVYFSLQSTTAINGALIFTLTPVVIVLLSWALFRDRVSALQAFGIAVSFTGAVVVVARGSLEALSHFTINRGDLYMLVADVVWALYSVLLRRTPRLPGLFDMMCVVAAVGVAALAPLYLWEAARGAAMPLSWGAAATVLYVGLGASIAAFILWNRGVSQVGANRSGLFLHLMPVYSAVLAMLFLGEAVRAFHLVGIALILGGIALATRTRPA